VNNAAYQMTHDSIDEISDAEWQHTFATNIHAQFYLSKAALKHMPSGGSIVNTTSIQADKPSPGLLAYATSKGAIANFTAGPTTGRAWHSRERCGAGSNLDAVDPVDDAARKGRALRREHTSQARRAA